jgi:hypothetical protein
MFYRYQQSLIDEATTTVSALLQYSPSSTTHSCAGLNATD